MFRDGPDVRYYSYKIMIAIPSWYDVKMEMIGNSSACSFTKITAYIKTIRREMFFEYYSGLLDQKHQITIFFFSKFGKTTYMSFGSDKEMPVGIWESVEKDNPILVSVKKEIFLA